MKILAIESSCDETAAAVVEDGTKVLTNVVASQVEIHQKYGGVVPEVASRQHLEAILPVLDEALQGMTMDDIDAIAVTKGPGLMGSLLVGVMAAKTLAMTTRKPLIGVNHIEGHIYANFLEEGVPLGPLNPPKGGLEIHKSKITNNKYQITYPLICLVVSGGHTEIFYVPEASQYQIVGRTRDDAAGECFDKAARYLGLGYPGGPLIDKLAKEGNPAAIKFPQVNLSPINEQTKATNLDFSFSGLKTEITMYKESEAGWLRQGKNASGLTHRLADLVASFQDAVVDILIKNTIKATQLYKVDTVLLAGGVSANSRLRAKMAEACEVQGLRLNYPQMKYCTDNAAMIGAAAYPKWLKKEFDSLDLIAQSRMPIDTIISETKS